MASAEGVVGSGGGVVAEEAEEVDIAGGAAGEVDVAVMEAGIDPEYNGLGKAGTPDLGYEGVDLAGRIDADGDDVRAELVRPFGAEPGWGFAGDSEGFADFGFGGLEGGEGGVAGFEDLFGGFGAEEEMEGFGGVALCGAAGCVEESGEVFEGGCAEAGFAFGEVGEGGFVAEVGKERDAGEPLKLTRGLGRDGLGAPEGEEAAGGGGIGAVAGEERGSGWDAEGGVVVDEEGGVPGRMGLGRVPRSTTSRACGLRSRRRWWTSGCQAFSNFRRVSAVTLG